MVIAIKGNTPAKPQKKCLCKPSKISFLVNHMTHYVIHQSTNFAGHMTLLEILLQNGPIISSINISFFGNYKGNYVKMLPHIAYISHQKFPFLKVT
jgi:hypothetical protein